MKYMLLWLGMTFITLPGYSQSELPSKVPVATTRPFLQKGMGFIGTTGGASTRESTAEETIFYKVIEGERSAFDLTLSGGYLLSDLFAVGGSVSYDWLRNNQLNEDDEAILTDVQEAGSSITGAVFIKNFIPLTPNGRFNLYNITGMAFESKRKTTESISQDILTRKYTEAYSISLGISPGIQVFVMKNFAAEVGVNVAGISTTTTKTSINGEPGSTVHSGVLDLKINVLSLKLGFYTYFKP